MGGSPTSHELHSFSHQPAPGLRLAASSGRFQAGSNDSGKIPLCQGSLRRRKTGKKEIWIRKKIPRITVSLWNIGLFSGAVVGECHGQIMMPFYMEFFFQFLQFSSYFFCYSSKFYIIYQCEKPEYVWDKRLRRKISKEVVSARIDFFALRYISMELRGLSDPLPHTLLLRADMA